MNLTEAYIKQLEDALREAVNAATDYMDLVDRIHDSTRWADDPVIGPEMREAEARMDEAYRNALGLLE